MKILEYIILIGVIAFLGLVFLYEVIDLFMVRPFFRLFKRKRRRRR